MPLTKRSKRAVQRYDPSSFSDKYWPDGLFYAYVKKVYDGDTVFIGFVNRRLPIGVWLRVLGVDTPETRTRNAWEKKAGLLVKADVKAKIEGRIFPVRIDDHDKYGGRVDGTLYLDESCQTTLKDYLLSRGFAKVYTGKGARDSWTEAECEALVKTFDAVEETDQTVQVGNV